MDHPDTAAWISGTGHEIFICATGARTPLGLTAAASAAAVRGGISALGMHPFALDKTGAPVRVACDARIGVEVDGASRIVQMLVAAIDEAIETCAERIEAARSRVYCWIGLPETRRGLPEDLGERVASALAKHLALLRASVRSLPHGHASGLMAMLAAARQIAARQADVCIVAGADSWLGAETLRWLDLHGMLMSAANRDGFPPGEAAGACLLATRRAAERLDLPVLAHLHAVATSFEANNMRSRNVCTGLGLTAAIRGVTAALRLPEQAAATAYCDMNGQPYRSEEFMFALLRTQAAFIDPHDVLYPADCWGDVGAASGPLFAALAIESAGRGYAKGAFPLLWAGSAGGQRAAAVLKLSAV